MSSNNSVGSAGDRSRSSSHSSIGKRGDYFPSSHMSKTKNNSSKAFASNYNSAIRGRKSESSASTDFTQSAPKASSPLTQYLRHTELLGNPFSRTSIQSNRKDSPPQSTKTQQSSQRVPDQTKIPTRPPNSPYARRNYNNGNKDQDNGEVKTNRNQNILHNGPKKSTPVSYIQVATESHCLDSSNKVLTGNETDVHTPTTYLPKHDLHHFLNNCAWDDAYHVLKELAGDSDQILIEINVASNDDASVLHTACWKAPFGITQLIMEMIPTKSEIFLKQDKDGNTPFHLLCANIMPYYDESSKPALDVSILKALITKASEVLTIQNVQGETPLHLFVTSMAASSTTLGTIQPLDITAKTNEALFMIFDNLPSKVSAMIKDNTGATPFHAAIASRADSAILMALLDFCPSVCKVEDGNGCIPLHYVFCFDTQASVVRRMVDIYQYGPCHKSKFGDTPLHILVRNSADDVAYNEGDQIGKKKLLNRNAIQILHLLMGNSKVTLMEDGKSLNEGYDPLFITNNEQLTPIHCCALFHASVQVTQIIMAHPSSARAALVTNAHGATPLHLAAAQSSICVDISTAVGTAESAIVKDKSNRTPLHVAALNKNATTGLIESIVDLNSSCCEIEDENQNTALHLACQSGAKEHIIEALLKANP